MKKQSSPELKITPDTRIAELLEAYPALEEKLIEMAPEFKKLKNPVLRRTIARVANLKQVAQLGNISLGKLINELRTAVGHEDSFDDHNQDLKQFSNTPVWFAEENIVKTLDARPMLISGEHPVNIVMKEIADLQNSQIYELITPFLPAPLIDMAKKKGFQNWTRQEESEMFRTYFTRS